MDSDADDFGGFFQVLGAAVGGAAGSLVGPGVGTVVGGAVGGIGGKLVDDAIAGSGAPPKKKAKKAPPKKKATPPPPGVSPSAMKNASAALHTASAARPLASKAIAQAASVFGANYSRLAKAAGVSPTKAKASGMTASTFVNRLGVERIAAIAGVDAARLVQAAGVSPKAAVQTGLTTSRAERAASRPMLPHEIKIVLQACEGLPVIARLHPDDAFEGVYDEDDEDEDDEDEDYGSIATTAGRIGAVSQLAGKAMGSSGAPTTRAATTSGVTPGGVPVRAGNWDLDGHRYRLAQGDTLYGLGITYLGSGNEWRTIWAAQPDSFRWNNNPDKLAAGTWLAMPPRAVENAKALTRSGQVAPGTGIVTTNAKVTPNGVVTSPSGQVVTGGGVGGAITSAKAAIAKINPIHLAVGTAVVAGVGYLALRK